MNRKMIRKQIAERDGAACFYCGTKLILGKSAHRRTNIDHKVPQCKDGTDELDNLVLSCRACNTRKGQKDLQDFLRQEEERYELALKTIKQRLIEEQTSKPCTKCKVEKDLSEYSKNATRPDGLHYTCKECAQKANKDYMERTRNSEVHKRARRKSAREYVQRKRDQ